MSNGNNGRGVLPFRGNVDPRATPEGRLLLLEANMQVAIQKIDQNEKNYIALNHAFANVADQINQAFAHHAHQHQVLMHTLLEKGVITSEEMQATHDKAMKEMAEMAAMQAAEKAKNEADSPTESDSPTDSPDSATEPAGEVAASQDSSEGLPEAAREDI